MKTILVLTDFSIRAEHAAFYALKLAQKVKANLLLCNVFDIADTRPESAPAAWPVGNYENFEENSNNEMAELASRLNKQLNNSVSEGVFRPEIKQSSRPGPLAEAVKEMTSRHHIQMAVISMHCADGLNTFLLGHHANEVIENAQCPVLIVPYQLPFTGFKKISFATDLTHNGTDILHSLYGLTKYFDSEILITHVTPERASSFEEQEAMNSLFDRQPSEMNYPKIYYRVIKNKSVAAGLNWMTEHTDIDLLVLVHRKRNMFQKLFDGGVTHKLADHLSKPMLVFPGSKVDDVLPVL